MNIRNKQLTTEGQKQGFTIIEVVLVLAIAGLIFLMVFLALPALQRGQRDNQRQQDLSRISTQVNAFSTSARGKIPTSDTLGTFVQNYLGEDASTNQASSEYSDPSGVEAVAASGTDPGVDADKGYVIKYLARSATTPSADITGTVYYTDRAVCSDDGTGAVTDGKARNYSLRVALENQKTLHCIDNR